jgi:hypothetical protein
VLENPGHFEHVDAQRGACGFDHNLHHDGDCSRGAVVCAGEKMTQPQIAAAFNVPSLAGTGDFVDGAFTVPEGQTARGMGQLFSSSDVSEWGIGEWAAIAVGGYLAISLFNDAKTVGSKVGSHAGRAKRSVKRAASGATSGIGKIAIVAGLAFAGYLAYQYFTNQAATPAAGSTTT